MEFNQYPSQYYDYNVHGYLPSLHWCSRCPSSTKWVSTSFPLPSHPFQQPVYPTPTPPENPPFPLPDQLEVISNSIQDLVVKLKESNSCMLSTFSHMQSLLQEMRSDLMALDDATLEDAIDTAALGCISETDSDLIKGNSRTVDIKEETKYVEENYSINDASKVLATQVFDEMFKPLSTVKCGFEVKEDEANAFVHHNTQLESTNKVFEIACEVPITDFPFDPGTCSVEDLLLGYFVLIQHHVFDTMSCRIYCSKLWEVLSAECSINSTSRYSGDSTLQLERITIYHDAIRGVVEVQGELKEIIHYIRDPKTYTHLSGPLANTMLFFCFLATGHNMLSRVAKITFDSDLDTGQSEELLQDACDDFNVFRYAQSATKLLTSESESSLEVGQYHVDSLFAKSIERDTEKSVHYLAYKESLLMSLDYQACPVPLATLKLTKTDYLFEDALLRHAHNDPCPQAILVDTLGATRDILWLQQNLCIRVCIWFGTGQSIILVGKPGFGQCLVELSIAGSKYWWTVLAAYTSAFSITSTSCESQLQPKHCNILRNMGNTMVCLLRSFVDGNHRVFEASARYFAIAYYSAESQQVVTTQLIHVSHCDPAKICRDNGQVTRFDNFPWDLFVHSAVIGVYVQSAWLNQKRSLFSVLISHVMIAALARTPTVTDIAVHIYENSGRCRSMLESELSLVAAKDEMTSLKVCIIRMTGGQSDIYYVIGKSRKSVQNSPFLEKLMTGGYTILFRENVVDAYAAGKLKEYDGTKLVSATKERLKLEAIDEKQRKKEDTKKSFDNLCKSIKDILGDKVQKMIICDRIVNSPCRLVIGEYGWPTYLTRVMKACLLRSSSMSAYMSREKVVEIKWDSGILQELSKKAEVDKNDKYVKDLVLLLHAVGRDGTVMPALEEKENSHLTIAGNTRVIYQASGKVCFTIAPAGWSFTLLSFAKPYVKPHGVSFDAAKFAESSFLPKLGFRPFYYGLKIMYAYENILAFSQKVLDLLEDLIAKLAAELPDGFGLSMVLAYLIVDIVPHVFIYAYIFATKRKYSFRVYREVHEYLQGLSKFDAAPASPVTILAYKHYYAPDDRSVSWSLCARCVHHGTVFTMSSLTKVNRLLLSTFILWFPSCQHGFIFAQCYLPEGFQIVTVIIGWSLLSGSLHLSQFALVGFGRSLDNTHWVNVALTSPNKKLYNVGLYSIVHEIFGVMGQLLARIRYILSFSELMIMKIVGISNLKMVEVLVGFFVLNLEDKVLIEGRGIVMNVTKLEDTFVELSNYVWDPD